MTAISPDIAFPGPRQRSRSLSVTGTLAARRFTLTTRTPRELLVPLLTPVLFALVIAPALKKALHTSASYESYVAVGTIDYGGGETGYLVYIKSSLSGDENDYIRDYARRNDTFPHETTGDQFFSEEQFEVYRALGFHMTHGFLTEEAGADALVVNVPGERCARRSFCDRKVDSIRAVRRALGLSVEEPPPATSAVVVLEMG